MHQVFDAAGNGSYTDHGTQNQYGYYGHLVAVADAIEVGGVPRTVYREIIAMNARGQVTNERLGVKPSGSVAVTTEFFY